jgi:hypothetical protein
MSKGGLYDSGELAQENAPKIITALQVLQLLAEKCDCDCQHGDEDCCFKAGEPCASCYLAAVLASDQPAAGKPYDYDTNPSPEQMVYKLRVAAHSWHEGTIQGAIVRHDIVLRLAQAADTIERLAPRADAHCLARIDIAIKVLEWWVAGHEEEYPNPCKQTREAIDGLRQIYKEETDKAFAGMATDAAYQREAAKLLGDAEPSGFTDAEKAAIADLAKRQDISEHKVPVQALRLYQMHILGVGDKADPATCKHQTSPLGVEWCMTHHHPLPCPEAKES